MSIAELKQACFSANSDQEILQAFKKLEEISFNKEELGMACWEFANEFHEQRQQPEKILCLCKKGLEIFDDIINSSSSYNRNYALVVARILLLVGRVCHESRRYSDSISYLNMVVENLTTCLKSVTDDSSYSDILADVHFELSRVKRAIGLIDDAGYNLTKGLEMCGGKCSDEVGKAIQQVADDYKEAKNFKEALSFYWKAEEIYAKQVRPDGVLLMEVRRSISLVYLELGENEKALEVSRLSLTSLRSMDYSLALIDAELLDADILMRLKRFDEALEGYESVVSLAKTLGEEGPRVSAFTSMGKACYNQDKFSEAKKHVGFALGIVEKKLERDSNRVFLFLEQISLLYELMDEFESAISLAGRLLAIHDLPEKFLVDYSERLFNMINEFGNEKHVMWFEQLVERLKLKLVLPHFQVGHGYVRCGTLYLKFGNRDKAAEYLALANSVMDVCLSPHRPGSLVMGHDLSMSYAAIGSYSQAIKCEVKVVRVLELVPSHQDLLVEALEMLNKFKQKASEERQTVT